MARLHNVTPVSQPTEGSVGNQIVFACYYIAFGIMSIYKQSKVLVHTGSSFGINVLYLFLFRLEAMMFKHKGNEEIKLI